MALQRCSFCRVEYATPDPQPHERGSESETTELGIQETDETALDTERKVPVPMRVIPKAQLGRNLTLSPRERLHIEVLTRQRPKPVEKPIFRERLQIYHIGAAKERALVFGKVFCITGAALSTFVLAPAYLSAGAGLPIVALIWLAGFLPIGAVHYLYTPMASRVFLRLPAKARETSKAAMEYAKNLPRDVDLEIEYLQPWALPRRVKARVAELEPVEKRSWLQPLTVRWRSMYADRRPRFSPAGFWLQPQTKFGAASTNTIPGLWDGVYKQLVATPANKSIARWDKSAGARSVG